MQRESLIDLPGAQVLVTLDFRTDAPLTMDAGDDFGAGSVDFAQRLDGFSVSARLSNRTAICGDPSSQVHVILHGEVYVCDPLDRKQQARIVHEQYSRFGIDGLARQLNGSFVVWVVDTPRNIVHLVTDRLGSKKAFCLEQNGRVYLASSMRLLPACLIDPVGAVTFLHNSFNFSERTVLAGVRSLRRASVHSFSATERTSHEYWSFRFAEPSTVPPRAQAQEHLAELTRAAVRRRIPATGRIFVSLSGGIDSRAVLGCLLEAVPERERLIALSYGIASDGDVATAARLAAEAGIEHRLTGFSGDLVTSIRRNGLLGEGMVDFYGHGLDFLFEARGDFTENDVMFVGDTVAQRGRSGFRSLDEVLVRGIEIQSPARVPAYYSCGEYNHNSIREAMEAELTELKRSLEDFADLQDVHDYLFIDQRTSNMLLTWREFHISRFITVANPLLDNALLDFYRDGPAAYRLDKTLHRETIPLMFPKLCEVAFADSGVDESPVHEQIQAERLELSDLISGFNSRLDALLPPEILAFALRDTAQDIRLSRHALPAPLRSVLDRLRRRYLKGRLMQNLAKNDRKIPPGLPLPALGVRRLEPILALRCFLAD